MNTLEIIATISTILCVWFTSKQNILCWPMGIISVLSLIAIYIKDGMYAQIGLQSVFLVQSIIGWYNWGKSDVIKISSLPLTTFLVNIIFFIILGSLFCLTHDDNTPLLSAFFDGTAALLGLLGNWYLTRKIIQAWPLFMTYNVIMVFLLMSHGFLLLSFLNVFLFIVSINGFILWKKDLKVA
jgi:nicotinamide mononucleotide transporter